MGPHSRIVAVKGTTYKVPVEVNGIKTSALLDHGVQVSLASKELLPLIKENNKWFVEQCDTRNFQMSGQPVGAGGDALGAVTVVALNIVIQEKGITASTLLCVEILQANSG